ncbi:unnamed protein product, partial [Pylaiella littoralis]
MVPQALLGFMVAWWSIWLHIVPALSQDDAGSNPGASANIGGHRPTSLFGDGGKLHLPVAQEMFWNSFFLQNVAGDLPSAVKGFDS